MQELAAERKPLCAKTVSQESEMPDADESFRQDVQEEAAQELDCIERHHA